MLNVAEALEFLHTNLLQGQKTKPSLPKARRIPDPTPHKRTGGGSPNLEIFLQSFHYYPLTRHSTPINRPSKKHSNLQKGGDWKPYIPQESCISWLDFRSHLRDKFKRKKHILSYFADRSGFAHAPWVCKEKDLSHVRRPPRPFKLWRGLQASKTLPYNNTRGQRYKRKGNCSLTM